MRPAKIFYLLLFFFLTLQISFAQSFYKYPIVNYTRKDYGENQNAQNWSITQSKEGLIYSGSSNGVIEFDGYKWDFLKARTGFVYSLANDSSNVLYIGGENYFGCYLKDSVGRLFYEPLSEKLLPQDLQKVARVWRTFAGTDKVYFQTNDCIYVYDHKTIKIILPSEGNSFHVSAFIDNTLYVRERNKGLMRCVNDKLLLIPNSQLFAEYGFFGILPFKDSKSEYLIITQEKGLFVYNKTTDEFKEFPTSDDAFLNTVRILGGIRLKNGNYAFNSQTYGTILLDIKSGQMSFVNSVIGLQDDNVTSQFEDKTGNLWLTLNSGLAKVNLRSDLQSFTSMDASVYNVLEFHDRVFAATSKGMFIRDQKAPDFLPEPGFQNKTVWQLAENNDKLYIVTDAGLFQYDGKAYSKIKEGSFKRIKFLKNGKILLAATGDLGLSLLNRDFKEEYNFAFEIVGEIWGIEEKPENGRDYYWVSTTPALYKIIDDGSQVFKVDVYGVDFGLTDDWKYPFLFNDKLVVGNRSGLFELQKDAKGEIFEPTPFYKFETSQLSFDFLKDLKDKTLAIIDNKPHIIYKKDNREVYQTFLPIDLGKEHVLYSDKNDLYICLEEGLVLYDETRALPSAANEFNVVLRKVTTKADSVLFDGASIGVINFKKELTYGYNELTFEFSSNYLNCEDKTLFRYKLEGADTSFSAWQAERKVKFNNLHEGSYKLIIQSKNVYETIGKDAVVEFKILPPWYRTTLAYILYVVGFIVIVFLAIRIASYRLKQQNKQLDELVKLRTKEIEHKNEVLKEQNEEILHQKQEITDSINYAKRIQNAILPPLNDIHSSWKDTFIFFQPKDIVSGDFYWYHKIDDTEFLIASADCTGHGVPGGFMSMVCSDKLNEAVNHSYEPDEILKMVNRRIKQSLRQDNKEGSTKDGMEIALLKVNTETKKVKYAGANRFLWIIRKGSSEVEEIRPTKAGIGGYTEDTQDFMCHEIQFNTEDIAYMSTDGYGDQFGGPEGKKLMTKSFKQFLLSIKDQAIDKQGDLASNHINNWKANYEQVDDILVIGVKF
ncbi:MAG: SpoIIE family protein phosphatase [Bacteroidota bacterium]|nr:SpoIIE family protein phosphatase [Bacteroidota bacterium]